MKKFKPSRRKRIAKKRKKPIVLFGLFLVLVITGFILAMKYNHIFNLPDDQTTNLVISFYIGIIVASLILIFNTINFFRTGHLLKADLENVYYNKSLKNTVVIPILDINNITARAKKSKRKKVYHGTLIIKADRTYKIRGVNDVEVVKNEIKHVIERQQAYLLGVQVGKEMKDEQKEIINDMTGIK